MNKVVGVVNLILSDTRGFELGAGSRAVRVFVGPFIEDLDDAKGSPRLFVLQSAAGIGFTVIRGLTALESVVHSVAGSSWSWF
jgi:hypothetical protein